MRERTVLGDRLLSAREVAGILGYSPKYTYRFLREKGPAPVKAARDAEARWWASDIDAMLRAPK